MTNQTTATQAADTNPLSDEYVNAVIQQHGYDSPECVIARLHQWIGLHGGENGLTLLMYEAHKALVKLRAPVADERAAFIAWLTGSYPNAYSEPEAVRLWHHGHVATLAWQERGRRAALASAPVAGEALGWRVRERRSNDGKLLDCFVEAPAVPGMAYAQEVLGDDYAEAQGGIEGKLKHCQMIVAWANAAPLASEAE